MGFLYNFFTVSMLKIPQKYW